MHPVTSRLCALRSLPCPACTRAGGHGRTSAANPLAWTGTAIACDAGHTWASAEALITDGPPREGLAVTALPMPRPGKASAPAGTDGPRRPPVVRPRLALEWQRRESERHSKFQEALERAVGDWVPPEARE